MILENMPEIRELSPEEQLQLASEIWEKNVDRLVSDEAEAVFEDLLKSRLDEYRDNPDAVVNLEDLRRKAGLS
ncbi:MAG: addiction module protein [Verrucomicrobiota bacterium]